MRLWPRRPRDTATLVTPEHAQELRQAVAPIDGESDRDYMGRMMLLFGATESEVETHRYLRAHDAAMEAWLAGDSEPFERLMPQMLENAAQSKSRR